MLSTTNLEYILTFTALILSQRAFQTQGDTATCVCKSKVKSDMIYFDEIE